MEFRGWWWQRGWDRVSRGLTGKATSVPAMSVARESGRFVCACTRRIDHVSDVHDTRKKYGCCWRRRHSACEKDAMWWSMSASRPANGKLGSQRSQQSFGSTNCWSALLDERIIVPACLRWLTSISLSMSYACLHANTTRPRSPCRASWQRSACSSLLHGNSSSSSYTPPTVPPYTSFFLLCSPPSVTHLISSVGPLQSCQHTCTPNELTSPAPSAPWPPNTSSRA